MLFLMNYKTNLDNHSVEICVNTKIYSIGVIYSVSYLYTEDCYVMLDGDPNEEIIVELKPKSNQNQNFELMAQKFFNDLIVYADYEANLKKNIGIREIILRRLLLTNLAHDPAIKKEERASHSDYIEKELKPWKSQGIRTNPG